MQTKRWLFITVVVVLLGLFLAACNSSPSAWSYTYETKNFEEQCPFTEEQAWNIAKVDSGLLLNPDEDKYQEALDIFRKADDCRKQSFIDYLNQMGEQGWEIVSVEILTDEQKLNIEREYKVLWKKPR